MTPRVVYYLLLTCIGILIIAGAGAYYLSHVRLQEKISRVEQLNADIVLSRERLDKLQELERSYDNIQPLEEKMGRMLPKDKEQSEVAAQIYAMIDSTNMQSGSITFESTDGMPDNRTQTDTSDVEGVRVMPINFSINGSYGQLQNFLKKIERQERLMQVNSLSVQRSSEEDSLLFNIQLEVFIKS